MKRKRQNKANTATAASQTQSTDPEGEKKKPTTPLFSRPRTPSNSRINCTGTFARDDLHCDVNTCARLRACGKFTGSKQTNKKKHKNNTRLIQIDPKSPQSARHTCATRLICSAPPVFVCSQRREMQSETGLKKHKREKGGGIEGEHTQTTHIKEDTTRTSVKCPIISIPPSHAFPTT